MLNNVLFNLIYVILFILFAELRIIQTFLEEGDSSLEGFVIRYHNDLSKLNTLVPAMSDVTYQQQIN